MSYNGNSGRCFEAGRPRKIPKREPLRDITQEILADQQRHWANHFNIVAGNMMNRRRVDDSEGHREEDEDEEDDEDTEDSEVEYATFERTMPNTPDRPAGRARVRSGSATAPGGRDGEERNIAGGDGADTSPTRISPQLFATTGTFERGVIIDLPIRHWQTPEQPSTRHRTHNEDHGQYRRHEAVNRGGSGGHSDIASADRTISANASTTSGTRS